MRRKFLSVVLCVCMMLTMAPFAFAAGTESTTPNPSTGSASSGGSGTPVAQVGETTYGTLRAAVAAVQNGGTITLLRDATGSGIGTYRSADGTAQDKDGNILITSKSFTIDFDGHTYSLNTPSVGSKGYETQGFHFEWKGSSDTIPNITLKNGTLDVATQHDANMKMLIMNYCNLTLDNMVLDGSNLENAFPDENPTYNYTTSNCCGTTVIKDTTIISKNADTDFAFDVDGVKGSYSAATVTVEGNSTIIGKIEVNDSGNRSANTLTVQGGAFTDVATAVKYAENNATIKVAQDTTSDVVVPADKTITLDLNGHKIVNSSTAQDNTVADNLRKHTITNNGTLTIMDSVGTGVVDNVSDGRAALYNTGTITEIKGGKFTSSADKSTNSNSSNGNSWYVVYNAQNATITKISAGDFLAIGKFSSLFSNCGTIGEISGGTFTQDGFIAFKNEGTVNKISGGTFSSKDESCIQNWGTIGEICGGAITAGSIGIWNFSSDKYSSAGKVTNISGGEIKGTTAAIRLNDYDATYLNPTKPSSTNRASATISGGKINGVLQVNANTTLTITGGYFTTDPTAYLAQDKGLVDSDLAGYYKVGDSTVDVDTEVKAGEPSVDVPANSGLTKADVENAAKSQATQNSLAKAASSLTSDSSIVGNKDAAKNALLTKNIISQDSTENITVVVQPYLNVDVTEVNTTDKTMSVNISALYDVIATTNPDNIELTGASANATTLKTAQPMSVSKPVTIKLPLPSGFDTTGGKLSIKHTKDNSVEYYTGTVTVDTPAQSPQSAEGTTSTPNTYVTFTTNGFSPFVIYAASANVASIGENANQKVYPTLQAAIDAVQNGETITLLKDTDENVTVSKAVKFTLAGTNHLKGTISAGSRYNLTQSGDTYTVTRQSSGSSSGSTPTTYAVNVNAATNGAVAADKKTASKGTTVTVTASPSKGYVVDAVKVVDKDGKDVAVTEKDGKYVFTMPASAVTVTGSFKAETPAPVALPFTDVKSGNWFYDAVKYAYAQGLMTGTSATTFAPNGTMNRAMIVTVLYRLEKSPAVTGASKFTDVPAGQWYSDAVAWAAANKIVNGYDETTFGPMNAVTREQMAAILFRYEQVKGLENVTLEENLNRFPDQNKISAYAIPALQWAVGQKIINGNADGTLDPTGTATRAQVAQIFTNLLNK